jgi:hypothetical protein
MTERIGVTYSSVLYEGRHLALFYERSEIRCGPAWSGIRATIGGRAIAPMRRARMIRFCQVTNYMTGSPGLWPIGRRTTWALFRTALDDEFVEGLGAATKGGWALGNARFRQKIAKALGRRVASLARGWPPKAKAERRQLITDPNSSRGAARLQRRQFQRQYGVAQIAFSDGVGVPVSSHT